MALSRRNFFKLSGLASLSALPLSNVSAQTPQNLPLIKPKPLKRGDTIGLVAPASPIYSSSEFDQMLVDLEKFGFELKLGKYVRDQHGYLAGLDENRAEDLMNMFRDPEVDGIICIRGGWGCNRILPMLDYEVIKANPKVFLGFSDITSLHLAFYKNCGLVTFHGPVGKSKWTNLTTRSFKNVLWQGKEEAYKLPNDEIDAFTVTPGVAQGKLLGGNLSLVAALVGTPYLPSFKDSILFLEDVGEDVYRIDRMLTQLKLAGILDEISGFAFGKCTDCDAGDNSLSLNQVLDDHIKPLNIPAFYGAMISHEDDNVTLPVGVKAEMNAETKQIRLLEPGVI